VCGKLGHDALIETWLKRFNIVVIIVIIIFQGQVALLMVDMSGWLCL
jgi:hypothetical protein